MHKDAAKRIVGICINEGMRGAEIAIYLCKRGCGINLAARVLGEAGFKTRLNNWMNPTSLFVSDRQIQFLLGNLSKATEELIAGHDLETITDFLANHRNIEDHLSDIVQPLQEVIWDSEAWIDLVHFS